jgi:Uma2 family endonuclease
MSSLPSPARRRFTPDEYLAIERMAEVKSEFVDGEIFAMSGASPEHALITANVSSALHERLRKHPCRVYSPDLRLGIDAAGLYCYPDVIVLCGNPRYHDAERDTLVNPTFVVEVLSPSTESYDRGTKVPRYRRIPSLSGYLLVAQDVLGVELGTRRPDGGWSIDESAHLDSELVLPGLDITLPLAEIYEKTVLLAGGAGRAPRPRAYRKKP